MTEGRKGRISGSDMRTRVMEGKGMRVRDMSVQNDEMGRRSEKIENECVVQISALVEWRIGTKSSEAKKRVEARFLLGAGISIRCCYPSQSIEPRAYLRGSSRRCFESMTKASGDR